MPHPCAPDLAMRTVRRITRRMLGACCNRQCFGSCPPALPRQHLSARARCWPCVHSVPALRALSVARPQQQFRARYRKRYRRIATPDARIGIGLRSSARPMQFRPVPDLRREWWTFNVKAPAACAEVVVLANSRLAFPKRLEVLAPHKNRPVRIRHSIGGAYPRPACWQLLIAHSRKPGLTSGQHPNSRTTMSA